MDRDAYEGKTSHKNEKFRKYAIEKLKNHPHMMKNCIKESFSRKSKILGLNKLKHDCSIGMKKCSLKCRSIVLMTISEFHHS